MRHLKPKAKDLLLV